MGFLAFVVFWERPYSSSVVSGSSLGQKPEMSFSWFFKFSVRHAFIIFIFLIMRIKLQRFYPILILLLIGLVYYSLVFNLIWNEDMIEEEPYKIICIVFLVIFHFFLLLFLFTYFKVIFSNPGKPPLYWGFSEDPEQRKRRFCMICNNFKPERCHHCSTCQQCVLVMDHHCQWLNNCIGFKNRKIFILLLMYSFILIILILGFSVISIVKLCLKYEKYKFRLILAFVIFFLLLIFLIILYNFLQYHLDLINRNRTTIENLDQKRGNEQKYVYDMGKKFNRK